MDEDAEIEAIVLFLKKKGWFITNQWVNGPTHAHCGDYNIKAFKPHTPHAARRINIKAIISECELRALIDTHFPSSSDYIFGEELADPQCLQRFGDLLDGLS